jgi:ATP-dependent Clp protease ATP-binding subunit ClpB
MTSNMGSQIIQENFLKGSIEAATEAAKVEVLGLLKQTVRQFINRQTKSLMFISSENITKIVGLQLKNVTKCWPCKASPWTTRMLLLI